MDPERLAQLESIVSGMGVGHTESNELVEELLADRDHWHGLFTGAEGALVLAEQDAYARRLFEMAAARHGGTAASFARAEGCAYLYDDDPEDDTQASLDAAAHAQLEGQHAAAGGAPPAIVAAIDGGGS